MPFIVKIVFHNKDLENDTSFSQAATKWSAVIPNFNLGNLSERCKADNAQTDLDIPENELTYSH